MAAKKKSTTSRSKSSTKKRTSSRSKSSSSREGGKATKNPRQYKALRRKGLPKARAAKITNAGKAGSRKGGKKGGRAKKST